MNLFTKVMLTKRQRNILERVIKEYTRTANPVGSVALLERYDLGISPATMRAELALLEHQGYLYQPHISSGRVPTDKGYRYFVNSLMENRELSLNDQVVLQEELLKLKAKNARMARTVAKMLAAISQNLAISGLVKEEEYFQSGVRDFLNHPEFSNVDEICKMVEVLDYLDQSVDKLMKRLRKGEVKTFIGRDNPLVKSEGCSVVVSRCRFGDNEDGIIAIMGPKRMRYAKNISLIRYVTKLLDE